MMMTTLAAQLQPGAWHDGGDRPAFWPVFPVTFGLFWLAVIGMGLYHLRRRWTAAPAAPGRDAPDPAAKARSILAERFARGEIDEDEYLMRSSTLRDGG